MTSLLFPGTWQAGVSKRFKGVGSQFNSFQHFPDWKLSGLEVLCSGIQHVCLVVG